MFHRSAIVRQNDQSDCGAAALATVALHYRMKLSLEQIRDLAGTDRVGTNLWGLIQAAEQLGFSAKAVKGEYDALRGVPLPVVAHVINDEGLGHFVVLHRVRKNSVLVADPARGLEKMAREEFCKQWTGALLLLAPDGRPQVERAKQVGPWRRFVGLLTVHKSLLFEAIVCALLMTALGLSTSFFVKHLVDSVLVRGETQLLNALGIGMVLVIVFKVLFGIVRQYLLAYMGRRIDLTLVSGYTRHVLNLPMQFFEMRRVGEILSRVNDADKIREAISGSTLTIIVDGVLVCVSTAVLWMYDTKLALVATIFAPLLVGSVLIFQRSVIRLSREAMENSAKLQSHLVEDIQGVETVKAYGVETDRSEQGESHLVKLAQNEFSLQRLGMAMSSIGLFVTGLSSIVILWYGGHRVIDGALTIGELMFFNTLLSYMLGPLERLASVNMELQDAMVAVDRLYQVMDIEAEQHDDRRKVSFAGLEQGIELRNVNFRYGCRDDVLVSLNLTIPAGKTVAVVGESGSGKSTLIKLLMRFYDPTEGQLIFDGVDSRDMDLSSLRSRIGLVSQEPYIFNGTIFENIALGEPEATMTQVVKAAKAAGLEEFITRLPERYETVIGERGANLSGGQRQRLAIARALLRSPDFLIFDEATSHLDTATERAIQQSLQSELAGRTVLLVAHRLSTIRKADLIYVMDAGRVIEAGSHAELLQQEGRYAALWRAQSEGEPMAVHGSNGLPHANNGRTRKGVVNHAV
jgi:ATP-binding cassette subfamily B protein